MKKHTFLKILLIISFISFSQQKRDYKVYQFFGNDSLNGHICKTVKFNQNGQKMFEELVDYKSSKVDGTSDYMENYFYKDTLLIKAEETSRTTKYRKITNYKYNNSNQLTSKEFKSYDIRLKKNLKKGIAYGDCIIDEKDYDKNASWKIDSQIFYKYNSKNQLIEYYAPKYHWDDQNRYLYEYDENGKIAKETSLNHEEVIWEKYFVNLENGYDYIMNWENEFKISTRKDWPYHYEVRFYKDNNNNIIRQTITDKDGKIEYEIKKQFNVNNQITKEERFNENGEIEITHKYIYE